MRRRNKPTYPMPGRHLACFSLQDSCVAGGDAGEFSQGNIRKPLRWADFIFLNEKGLFFTMPLDFIFFLNSFLLGIGLAMDAFSVSLANGMNEPAMPRRRICLVAGTFGVFQAIMPIIGWVLVHFAVEKFHSFQKVIPWIALILLLWIGGKMIVEGVKDRKQTAENTAQEKRKLAFHLLLVQGIATSIDALSVGFTIAAYDWVAALTAALIIAVTTFFICLAGVLLGRKFGTWLSWKASVLGGSILVAIGIEVFIKGLLEK